MKTYRFWLLLIAGLIIVVFMFGRLVRGARAAERIVRIPVPQNGLTNFWPDAYFQTNHETIYFQTNVTSGDNSSGCQTCAWLEAEHKKGLYPAILHPPHYPEATYKPATERWWTTNIQQVSTLKLIWRGEPETIVRIKNVTNVTVRSKLKQEWSEPEADKPVGTNWANMDLLMPTNGVYSNLWIEGHIVKIITNKWGGITVEGLPETKGK